MSTVASRFIQRQTGVAGTRMARPARSRVEPFPAGRVVTIDTDDIEEFNQYAGGWSVQYQVLDAAAFRTSVFLVIVGSLQVALVEHAVGYSSQGENPAGALSIVVPLDAARPMAYRGRGLGPTEMAVIRTGEDYECLSPSGARFLVVSLAQEKMERYAADLWHVSTIGGHSADRLRFVDYAHRVSYLDACARILGVVDEQPGVLTDRRAAALLEEKLLESLLLNAHADPSSAFERGRYNVARKAYVYLQDRADDVPSIQEVCAATGASYATLERAFRETYGMTPKTMMTAMQLSRTRRALLHPSPTTTVTSVALKSGFVEFGRFSALYRQRYGEVPSETLRRTRGGPPQPDESTRSSTRFPGLRRSIQGQRIVNGYRLMQPASDSSSGGAGGSPATTSSANSGT